MKRINLKTIIPADKTNIRTRQRKICVFLHTGLTVYFTNNKVAKAFLVETNDFLNVKLFELNEQYIELFTQYRRMWFYFEFDLTGDTAIKNAFTDIERCMLLMVERGSWVNGPPMVWKWFGLCADSLSLVITILQAMHRRRNNFAEVKILEAVRSRVEYLKSQLAAYGVEK